MKNLFKICILTFVLTLVIAVPLSSSAQTSSGLTIYQNFLMGKVKCADLKDSDFFAVGDYVLKQVPEAQRTSLNVYINQYKGTLNDNEFSTLMGKIFTGCETAAELSKISNNAANVVNKGLPGYGGYWGMFSGIGMIWTIIQYAIGIVILIVIIKFIMRLVRGKKNK